MNKAPRMIFHHPLSLVEGGSSGSRLRPALMLQAFASIGYEVEEMTGPYEERRASARRIEAALASGLVYDFCYSESSTMPYALTEPHHLPIHGDFDLDFLAKLRGHGIPLGIFYRDAQWRLEAAGLGPLGVAKRRFARCYYLRELRRIKRLADLLYVPSREFAAWMGLETLEGLRLLPPGAVRRARKAKLRRGYAMAYVGGVTGPIYDIGPFLETARLSPDRRFLLVCREAEGARLSRGEVPANVELRSASGEELDALLEDCEYFGILVRPTPYFSLAMPVKLYEALGRGMPIIASEGTAAAGFIAREGAGWLVPSASEAARLLDRLDSGAEAEKAEIARSAALAAERNSWECRASQVAEELSRLRITV